MTEQGKKKIPILSFLKNYSEILREHDEELKFHRRIHNLILVFVAAVLAVCFTTFIILAIDHLNSFARNPLTLVCG